MAPPENQVFSAFEIVYSTNEKFKIIIKSKDFKAELHNYVRYGMRARGGVPEILYLCPISLLPFVSSLVVVPLGFLPPETPLSAAEPTRPAGPNMPFGLSFMGTAFSEFKLISFAYAYEQATLTRLRKRAFSAAIPKTQLKDIMRRS